MSPPVRGESAKLHSMFGAHWFSALLIIAGCADKRSPCASGYSFDADGVCVAAVGLRGLMSVSIGPDGAGTSDEIIGTVVVDGVEVVVADGEDIVTLRWFVDGETISGTDGAALPASNFEKGDAVSLFVEPIADGDGVWSNTLTIQNTPPLAPNVSIFPAHPFANIDDLGCVVDDVEDIDGDETTLKVEWTRDGSAWEAIPPPMDDGGGATPPDTGTTPPEPPPNVAQVPASALSAGERWTCHVSAFDGEEYSVTATASVLIQGGFTGWSSSTFELADSDYIFIGEYLDDAAGASLTMVGDVDADGLGDFLVPAYFNDEGAEDGGKVYLVRGADIAAGPGTYALGDMPIAFTGQTDTEEAGHAAGPAGDVDGDGLDDFLICGYRNDNPVTDVGRVYLFLGASLGTPGVRSTAGADISFIGEAENNRLGHSVGSAGDMDGDGLPELLMGAYGHAAMGFDSGKTYIIPGSSLVIGEDVEVGQDQYMYLGEAEEDASGHALRAAEDVDGDGLNDIVVGARRNNTGASEGGKAYVILGASLGSVGQLKSLADADFAYFGEEERGWLGYQASGAGDVDGDGLADIMFGAHTSDYERGRVYLIFGSSLGVSLQSAVEADVMFQGNMWADQAGRTIAPAGDVDGDGRGDVLIGARNAGDRIGRAYLVFGASIARGVFPLSEADVRFMGEERLDEAGYTVSSAGDVNGDGLDDVLIGAWQGNFDGDSAGPGRAYLNLAPSE